MKKVEHEIEKNRNKSLNIEDSMKKRFEKYQKKCDKR